MYILFKVDVLYWTKWLFFFQLHFLCTFCYSGLFTCSLFFLFSPHTFHLIHPQCASVHPLFPLHQRGQSTTLTTTRRHWRVPSLTWRCTVTMESTLKGRKRLTRCELLHAQGLWVSSLFLFESLFTSPHCWHLHLRAFLLIMLVNPRMYRLK